MVTATYSEQEYDYLLEKVNDIEPYAFYIVDSFGSMDARGVKKYFKKANGKWISRKRQSRTAEPTSL